MRPRDNGRYIGQFRPEFSRVHRDRDLYWIVPMRVPLILALVGRRFVGVSTTIAYLQERHGFDAYTLGGELRSMANELGVPVTHRRYLQDLGDKLRAEHRDAGYLARHTLRRIRADRLSQAEWASPRNVVVGGFKTVEELDVFDPLPGFTVVELRTSDDLDPPMRYRRVVASGGLREEHDAERRRESAVSPASDPPPSFDDLSERDRRRYFDGLDRTHQRGHPGERWSKEFRGQPALTVAAATRRQKIDNDTDKLDDLHEQIDRLLNCLRPPQQIVHR